MRTVLNILLIVTNITAFSAQHEHYNALFNEANQLYTQNNFEEAKNKYEQIVAAEVESAELYYNLANCYYKLKTFPLAILYYEKALKLNPNNNDIKFNLEIANQNITDKIEKLPEIFYVKWWETIVTLLSLDTWTKFTIYTSFALCALLFIFFLIKIESIKRISFYFSIFFALNFIITLLATSSSKNKIISERDAIVFSPSLNVKSSPVRNSTNLFVIHEGTKVSIRQTSGNWIEISLEDGNVGWIEKENIKII